MEKRIDGNADLHVESRAKRITYWIITSLIGVFLLNVGINDILKLAPYIGFLRKLGYPDYVAVIVGIWKILGVIAILIPKFPLLKEWAYAGFFFLLTGAIISHAVIGDNFIFQVIVLKLILISWYLRPASRRLRAA
ncbi:MAG: DoxX family protein [Bacteroidota bacterium]